MEYVRLTRPVFLLLFIPPATHKTHKYLSRNQQVAQITENGTCEEREIANFLHHAEPARHLTPAESSHRRTRIAAVSSLSVCGPLGAFTVEFPV